MRHSGPAACFADPVRAGAYCDPMTKTEHLQFLALMIPTVLVLVLAAVSLADPAIDVLLDPTPAAAVTAPADVDDAGHETAY
jgi:hypothetical protein